MGSYSARSRGIKAMGFSHKPSLIKFLIIPWVLVSAFIASPRPIRAQERDPEEVAQKNKPCYDCHLDPKVEKVKKDGQKVSMAISQEVFLRSAHKDLACVECHADIGKEKQPIVAETAVYDKEKKFAHLKDLKPVDCETFCHKIPRKVYGESLHVQAMKERKQEVPTCKDCHEKRETPRKEDAAHRQKMIEQCGRCHQSYLKTYRQTLHGQLTALGYTKKDFASCHDCHGFHDVLARPHPRSWLSASNFERTCRNCHKEVNAKYFEYIAHPEVRGPVPYPLLYYVDLFMVSLLGGTMGLAIIHSGLWLAKSLKERKHAGKN